MTARTLIVVEGYVDVIAMVDRGLCRQRSRRSAPRSPKTSSRCSGRWRTSRSSVSTATRPARRRPIAPPTWRCRGCKPGKSLRFALLPEGQDPDDLARSGGRERDRGGDSAARARSPTCSGRARSRAAAFDTPERRAALEARISELVQRHRRRSGAALLPPGSRRAAAAHLCAEAGAAATRSGNFARRPAANQAGVRPRGCSRARPADSPRGGAAAVGGRPDHRPRPLPGARARSSRPARSCAASAARCPAARR